MKKIVIILGIFCLSFGIKQSDFCDGWEKGYVDGWCYKKVNCYAPYVPHCPYPNYNEDNFMGGYKKGFLQGLNDRR